VTFEERFERIEADLQAAAATLKLTAADLQQTTEALGVLATAIGSYTEASNQRMKRMEENLDALIRALTVAHTNGKKAQ
jgi:hypothetical protein